MIEQDLYTTLNTAAEAHLLSCLPQTAGSNNISSEAVLSHLAPTFYMDWGHSYFVSTKPALQGELSGESFVSHLNAMASMLKTWSIDITSTAVDVQKNSVVVRADYHMVPKEGDEVVNEIIFWMFMDESGAKLVSCTEFVDPVASGELAKSMKGGPVR